MEEKKQIFVEYLYTQTVIHLLKHQKVLSQLSEINAIKLEETAVTYIKSSGES
jgi:hypothetical protein